MALIARPFLFSLLLGVASAQASCKPIPGDPLWPAPAVWQRLNETVQGRLIATVPLPSVCHKQPFGTFSQDACDAVKKEWSEDQTFIGHPAEIMNPYVQNQSCIPYTPASQPCELGNYASYSIKITGADDVRAGLNFVRETSVRLVIKNTGHDWSGKSTGKGALSLWTHYLNTTDIITTYESPDYNGPAVKLGAGVVGGEVAGIVGAAGYRILSGTCQTVGIAGGYTSGGGHSLLNGIGGMAADAVLEWEVVTAAREHLVATPTNNTDMYWALTGGGAGTFGVVLSMTTKIFPEGPIGSGMLMFNATEPDYWAGVQDLWAYLPQFVDAGPNTMDFSLTATGMQALAITVPDRTAAEVKQLLRPLLDALENRSIDYTYAPASSPTYLAYFDERFGAGTSGAGPSNIQLASRLIPRAGVLDPTQNAAIVAAMRAFVDAKHWSLGCHALNVKPSPHPDNAVLPGWRDAVATCNIVSIWDWNQTFAANEAQKQTLVNTLIPGLEAATPGAGTYLNEVDPEWKGDWKKELYGVNYPRLLAIKDRYDPEHLLYAFTAVGSDYWVKDADGRLCSAH